MRISCVSLGYLSQERRLQLRELFQCLVEPLGGPLEVPGGFAVHLVVQEAEEGAHLVELGGFLVSSGVRLA